MNREVLFRIKDHDDWYYGYPLNEISKNNIVSFQGKDKNGGTYFNALADATTLTEFANLTDTNGIRIFEGDIVQVPSNLAGTEFYIGTIEFGNFDDYNGNTYTGFYIKWNNVATYNTLRQSIIWWRDEPDRFLKVIGNKWDNPELLDGAK